MGDFTDLIRVERERVLPFLRVWGELLSENHSISSADLESYFLQSAGLSGVLYCSHSTVLSESFFVAQGKRLTHLTDREIAAEALASLPSAKDLTFSFPRKYEFASFYNSWGFVRVERLDERGNGAGVLLSVVTLDAEILELLKQTGFKHLAHLFNQSWNGSVHDYIHHLALYTNPSFGIGKRSPMSLAGLNGEIDRWGEEIVDTFNYEYWAHRTHHLITARLAEIEDQVMIQDAQNYFLEVALFQESLIRNGYDRAYVQRVGEYLGSVYLWPLHILIHPYGATMESIGRFIEFLDLPQELDRLKEAASLLGGKQCPQDPRLQGKILIKMVEILKWDETHPALQENVSSFQEEGGKGSYLEFIREIVAAKQTASQGKKVVDFSTILKSNETIQSTFLSILSGMDETPLEKGISVALQALQIGRDKTPLGKGEWLRFKVAITVQRGMYNCWDHEHPVIFQKQPTDPLTVFAEMFAILKKTLSSYQHHLLNRNSYELSGICP
jgi:hypothetical protein